MILIEVVYLEALHVPSDSEMCFVGVIVEDYVKNIKLSLKEIIDALFNKNHQKIFGENDNLIAGYPDSITIYFGGKV